MDQRLSMQSNPKADRLRELLASGKLFVTPCCGDALTAKLIQDAGFEMTFVSGFGISASRLGAPDAGLISFGEMLDQVRNIGQAIQIPMLVDGDNGYGNAMNVRRTVDSYAQAGAACVMIEDQVAPKRCGHTQGKQVVDHDAAMLRIQAAVDARNEGTDILIMARTDSLESLGMDEALKRARSFRELGADITFVEAPRTADELQRIAAEVDGPKMANMLEGGHTPLLPPDELQTLGFSIAAYPFTLLMSSIHAIQSSLREMRNGLIPPAKMTFSELKTVVGFDRYYEEEKRYAD